MINLIDKKGVQGTLGLLLNRVFMEITDRIKIFPKFSAMLPSPPPPPHVVADSAGGADRNVSVVSSSSKTFSDGDKPLLDRNATSYLQSNFNLTLRDLLQLYSSNDDDHHTSTTNAVSSVSSSIPIAAQLVWFDYHHKCKGDAVNGAVQEELFPFVQPAIRTADGIFTAFDKNQQEQEASLASTTTATTEQATHSPTQPVAATVLSLQQHIVRTNCMDCLDRTNVVQTAVSRWALQRQLAELSNMNTMVAVGTKSAVRAIMTKEQLRCAAAQAVADQCKDMHLSDKVRLTIVCCVVRFLLTTVLCTNYCLTCVVLYVVCLRFVQPSESAFRKLWTENGDYLSQMYAGSR